MPKISSMLMKLSCAVLLMLMMSAPFQVQAQGTAASGGPFGLGIVLGDPTAITGKYIASRERAYAAGLSFAFDRWFLMYIDGQHHFPGAFGRQNQFLAATTPYIGLGALIVISNREEWELRRERFFSREGSNRLALGMRIPLGVEWRAPDIPLGVFLEIAPGITVIPGTYGFVQGGLGVRYFF